jgi:hypothetical protein
LLLDWGWRPARRACRSASSRPPLWSMSLYGGQHGPEHKIIDVFVCHLRKSWRGRPAANNVWRPSGVEAIDSAIQRKFRRYPIPDGEEPMVCTTLSAGGKRIRTDTLHSLSPFSAEHSGNSGAQKSANPGHRALGSCWFDQTKPLLRPDLLSGLTGAAGWGKDRRRRPALAGSVLAATRRTGHARLTRAALKVLR